MNQRALFFKRICFWVLPISLFGAQSISQAKSKEVLSACQKTSLPNICQKLATLYQSNDIPFDIQNLDVCSWQEVKCNPEKNQVIGFYLAGKGLEVLPPGIFSGLPQLQELSLNENRLTSLPHGIFLGLSQLKELNLGFNQLTHLPLNIFAPLSHLQELYLSGNRLTSLPPDIFAGLSQLQYLGLNKNRLNGLPPGIFAPLS